MSWVNSKNPVKPIQKYLKKWVELGHCVGMVLKNRKSTKNNEFRIKSDPNSIHPITNNTHILILIFTGVKENTKIVSSILKIETC